MINVLLVLVHLPRLRDVVAANTIEETFAGALEGNVGPAGRRLLEYHPSTLGEASRPEGVLELDERPVCTICGEPVRFDELRAHLAQHEPEASTYELEQVRSRFKVSP